MLRWPERIREANREYISLFNEGLVDELVDRFFEADAELYPAGSVRVCGAAEIRRFWRQEMSDGIQLGFLETLSVSTVSDFEALELGTYELTSGLHAYTGDYLVRWRLKADTTIRIVLDIWNAR